MRSIALATLAFLSAAGALAQEEQLPELPPAIGPYTNLKPDDFRLSQNFKSDGKVVMTHDFYWYDDRTKAHLKNGDGTDALTTHPATLVDFSYKSVAWHKKQLADMMAAGIDIVLPVYWGAPSEHNGGAPMHWSFAGLPPLVQAAEELLQEGKTPPAIGLFYDTSTLAHNAWHVHVDLTTAYGKAWFYSTIRDFFSLIPPKLWALLDGRPVVVLYSASFARAHDQKCIDYLKTEFPRQFGGKVPYVIREASWRVRADNICAWGGAVHPNFLGVAEIGPGYDHSAVPGRTPLIVPREGRAFYERAWNQALRHRPHLVILETWNEFHEGTSIAESREHGRQYIDLTRKYVDLYKQGDDSFKWARAMDVTVEVEYVDGTGGSFGIQYDSHDPSATLDGAYKDCAPREFPSRAHRPGRPPASRSRTPGSTPGRTPGPISGSPQIHRSCWCGGLRSGVTQDRDRVPAVAPAESGNDRHFLPAGSASGGWRSR